MNWLESLPEDPRSRALEVMRELGSYSDNLLERSRPRPNTLQIGGELTDHFAKGSALFTFLKELGSGADLDVAIQAGKNEATLIFNCWNSRREWQVHRNPASLDDYMDGVKRRFLAIAESGNPGKENAA